MDELARLAYQVRRRRDELGMSQMDVWKKYSGPSSTKMGKIESGMGPAPSESTKRKLEAALRWAPGSVDAILQGNEPTPIAQVGGWESVPPNAFEERSLNPNDPVDAALQAFQRAAASLVQAENDLDSEMRKWASRYLFEEHGRPATAAEVAEITAWSALHDPREWTRYEMALIEYVFDDYPHDVRSGSTYADLSAFRERVRRVRPRRSHEEAPDPTTETDLSQVNDELPAAAKEGVIEEPGEFNT